MTRVAVADLVPATAYKVQVRAVSGGQYSEWSESFTFTTSQNATIPAAPATVTWTVQGDGFLATWTEVTLDISGGAAIIDSYELELTAGAVAKTVIVPAQKGQSGQWALDFQGNIALFGTAQPSISLRVRAVNNKGIKGNWSGSINAQNAVPANVAGFTGSAQLNGVDLSWTPNTDTDLDHYEIFTGTTSGFTPTTGNRIFTGIATHFFYVSTTYTAQYFKIRAVDKFGQPSATDAQVGPFTPVSPFVVDTTAPNTPTSLAASITNNANGIGATAAVTWVMTSPPSDLAGYNIRYRSVGSTNYEYMNGVDAGVLAAQVTYLQAYTNYEFQIQAYDFQYNKSAWSSTLTATSPSNAAPGAPTALTSVADGNSITYSWTAPSDQDIKNFEFTLSTSPTFASGNITYFNGTSTTLSIGGLASSTTYYGRVRSVDTAGSTSAFTSTDTRATSGAPGTSDGQVPGTGTTPSVLSGLSYLYVTWAPVTTNALGAAQNDTVTYEVHLSTTTGFTPSGATKVTEVAGTSAVVDNLPGTTTALSYGTTYFIKIVPKDRDGSGTASAQGSGTISKVASTDVTSIGADLIVPGTGFVNALVVNTGGSIQSSNYVASTTGWKIAPTGIEMNDSGSTIKVDALKAGTIGGVSGAGVIQVAAGTSLIMNGGYIRSNTNTGTTIATAISSGSGFYLGNDGLFIGGGANGGKIYANALLSDTLTSTTITLGAGGSIVGGSWTLNSSGLTIPNGGINAASLNLQIGQNLIPPHYADFEANTLVYSSVTNPLINVISGTAAVVSSQYYFNTQSLQWITTNTSNEIALTSSLQSADYNIPLNPGSSYIVSAYIMQPAGASNVTLSPRIQYKGGNVTNLLANGDFEASPSNSNWTTNGTIGTVSTAQVTQRRTGFKGQQLTQAVTGADTYISQTVAVSPNTTYTFGAHRIVNAVLTGGALSNRSLFWIDNGTGSGASAAVLNATTPTGSWIRDSVTFTTSATASSVTLRLYAPNGTVFWDNATLLAGATDYFDYIVDGANVTIPSDGNWARYSWVITIPSTGTTGASFLGFRTVNGTLGTLYLDGIQIEQQLGSVTTPSPWSPPSSTVINGGLIRTGSLISSGTTTVNGNTIPWWNINADGSASFANLQVRGQAVVGATTGADGSSSQIASSNYLAGSQGWVIRSDGYAEFRQMAAESIDGSSISGRTLSISKISSGSLDSTITLGTGTSLVASGSMGETVSLGSFGFLAKGPNQNVITFKASTTTTRTLTTANVHNFAVGQKIRVTIGDSNYDTTSGNTDVVVSTPTTTTFTYTNAISLTQTSTAVANGIVEGLNLDLTTSSPTYVSFPTDGTQPNIISGTLTADTVVVTKGMSIRLASFIEQGASLTINSVIQPPKVAASLTQAYDGITLSSATGIASRASLGYGNQVYLTKGSNGNYFSLHGGYDAFGVDEYNSSTGALVAGRTSYAQTAAQIRNPRSLVYGAISAVQRYYLHYVDTVTSTSTYTHTVEVYNTSWVLQGTFTLATGPTGAGDPAPWGLLGWDYTNSRLMFAWKTGFTSGSPNTYSGLTVRHYTMNGTTGMPTGTAADVTISTTVSSGTLGFVGRGDFDYGAASDRIILADYAVNNYNLTNYSVFTNTGTADSTKNWPNAGGQIVGAFWDTTKLKFVDVNTSRVLRTYEGGDSYWATTSMTQPRWVAYSWYKSTATISESTCSPTTSITLNKRAKISATITSIPSSGGNTPDQARVYVSTNATDTFPTNYFLRQTVAYPATTTTINPTGTPGASPHLTNDFAALSGSPGQIVSATGNSYWKGDDTAQFYQLVLQSSTDVTTAAGNKPALRIGNIAGAHARIDANEFQAMASDTTTADLILNQGGGNVRFAQLGSWRGGSAGSTLISGIDFGNNTATTNASGQITFNHNLGVNPTTVVAVPGTGHQIFLAAKTNTNMTFTCSTKAGVTLGSGTSVQILWMAIT